MNKTDEISGRKPDLSASQTENQPWKGPFLFWQKNILKELYTLHVVKAFNVDNIPLKM